MKSLYTVLFVIFGSIYGITAIYSKIVLKKYHKNIILYYTSLSDYKYLWDLAKKQKKYIPLFFIFISSTIFSLIMLILIVIS